MADFIPAIISGGSSILRGIFGSNAAKKAAAVQAQGQQNIIDNTRGALTGAQQGVADTTGQANDILSRSAATQLGMYAPYSETGISALMSLKDLASSGGPLDTTFSFNPTDLSSDPGYMFTLQQGQKAIQQAAAAKGGLFSSSTLKGLAGYTTGTANQYFNDAFNRALNTYTTNRGTALSRASTLQGLAGMGYGATSAGAGAVGSTSSQQAGNTVNEGVTNANLTMRGAEDINKAMGAKADATASGIMGSNNAMEGGLSGGLSALSQSIGAYLAKRNAKNTYAPGAFGPAYSYPQP